MLESRLGVIGRVDIDTFHPARIKRQKRLKRFQVIPPNQHIFRCRVAVLALEFKHPVGNGGSGLLGLVFVDPIEERHKDSRSEIKALVASYSRQQIYSSDNGVWKLLAIVIRSKYISFVCLSLFLSLSERESRTNPFFS